MYRRSEVKLTKGAWRRGRKIRNLKWEFVGGARGGCQKRGGQINNLTGGCAYEGQRSPPWGRRLELRQQPVEQM